MKKIKVVIFDHDGMLAHGPRFSDVYAEEFGVDIVKMNPFFSGPFQDCLVGKADLKDEIEKVLSAWGWNKSAEELIEYWLNVEDDFNMDSYGSIMKLREQGAVCCLATNQEKNRLKFIVDKFKYDDVFDKVFCSAEIGCPKTSKEGLAKIMDGLKKFGVENKDEIVYWDDDDDNIADLEKEGFNGQKYVGFDDFKVKMKELGFQV